jgi:Spy/CpxP family protein refolding chaperone
MKRLFFFAVLVSAVTAAGFWSTQRMCLMMKPRFLMGGSGWYKETGLPAEKVQTVKELDAKLQKEVHHLCAEVCVKRSELLNLMRIGASDEPAVYGKIEEIGGLQVSLEKKIAAHLFELKKVLSPEESQKYFQQIEERLKESIRQCGYSI